MADHRNPFNYPINPTFGQGIFRRKIRLSAFEGGVSGELEDCNHGFCVKIYHDGLNVTDIRGEAKRIPLTTCTGAEAALQNLIGTELTASSKAIIEKLDLTSHCTHWLDLAILCISHSLRSENERIYEIAIPDEAVGPTNAQLFCNGELLLDWQAQDWIIQEPVKYKNNTLYKGFASWANAIDDKNDQEAAFVMQKGYFVSRARRFDIAALADEPANTHTMMRGACYSYSEPRVDFAQRTIGSVRDFTDTEEQLLKFQ